MLAKQKISKTDATLYLPLIYGGTYFQLYRNNIFDANKQVLGVVNLNFDLDLYPYRPACHLNIYLSCEDSR